MLRSIVPALAVLLTVTSAAPSQYRVRRDAFEDVRGWYVRYLHREPDPAGIQAWVDRLYQGDAPMDIVVGILASEEYYLRAGSTPEGFVNAMLEDVVRRRPTGREMRYWSWNVRNEGRVEAAYAFLSQHPEAYRPVRGPAPRNPDPYGYGRYPDGYRR
jgi:hypothetical protein